MSYRTRSSWIVAACLTLGVAAGCASKDQRMSAVELAWYCGALGQ